MKKQFPDKWEKLNKNLAFPHKYFNSLEEHQKPVDHLKEEDFFSNLKKKEADVEEIERTEEVGKIFIVKNGEELTKLFLKSDVILLAIFEKFTKVSIEEFDFNPLCCVSSHGYFWFCGLKYTDKKLQTLQDKNLILLLENNIVGGISSVLGDRYVKSDETQNLFFIDAHSLHGYALSEYLLYD